MSETYFPKNIFTGATGQKSVDYAGAEAIKAMFDKFEIMFAPSRKHCDGGDGGIGLGNMQDDFIDDVYDQLINVPDGPIARMLRHIMRVAYTLPNNPYYEELTGREGVHGLRLVDKQGTITFEWYDQTEPDLRNRWKVIPAYVVENVAGWMDIFYNVLPADNFWTSPKVINPTSENTLATARSLFKLWERIKNFFSHLVGQGNPNADGNISSFIKDGTIPWSKIVHVNGMISWVLIDASSIPDGAFSWSKINQVQNMINWNLINASTIPNGAIPWEKIDWNGFTFPGAGVTDNSISDLINKVYGGGTRNADGTITWGTPPTDKIAVGNMNLFGTNDVGDSNYIRTRPGTGTNDLTARVKTSG